MSTAAGPIPGTNPTAPPPTEVDVPCTRSTTGPETVGFLRDCSTVNTEVKTNLDLRLKQHVARLYEGVSENPEFGKDFSKVTGSASPNVMSYRFEKPVCNVTPNEYAMNQSETLVNHLNESCGSPVELNVNVSVRRVFGKCVGARVRSSASLQGQRGLRESAYIAGSYIQALTCFKEQVKKEIEAGKLQISPTCQSLAADVHDLGQNSKKIADALRASLGEQENKTDIWKCKNSFEDIGLTGRVVGMDVGEFRQSAQHLCAARSAIEIAFNHLMACEVFARSGRDFRATVASLDEFGKMLQGPSGPNQTCSGECSGRCGRCQSSGSATACATSCANACYQRELIKIIQQLQQRWPSDGSCPRVSLVPAAFARRFV